MNRSHRAPLVLLPLLPLLIAAPAFAQTAPAPAPADAAPPAPPPAPPPPAAAPVGGGYDAVPPPPPPAPASTPLVNITTLRILKEKGIITQAEYDSAVHDMSDSVGSKGAGEAGTVSIGKFALTLYGFAEFDSIWDSTQSFTDLPGNGQVSRLGTYAGNNSRVTFGVRNSRLGWRLKGPEIAGIRSSGVIETDFLGNQNPIGPIAGSATSAGSVPGATGSGTDTEGQYFTNPALRVRHAYVKLETPVVDFLFGQYWDLYGWQQVYAPNTVELQGMPGQLYSRTPQIRISKSVKTDSFLFEAAVAALRPVQRDSAVPKGQAGIRIGTPAWSGLTTGGQTGTSIEPLSIAVTGDARSVTLPPFSNPTGAPTVSGPTKFGTSIAVDAFIPIIPAKKRGGNALSFKGEFSTGYGNGDMYTGLSGGAPATAYTYTSKGVTTTTPADIDPGIVMYDNSGALHLIQWTSWMLDLQYYLPGLGGKVWITGNLSNISSNNIQNFVSTAATITTTTPAKARLSELWGDGCLFWDATDSVRLGVEVALFDDEYTDRTHAQNFRTQFSSWYIF